VLKSQLFPIQVLQGIRRLIRNDQMMLAGLSLVAGLITGAMVVVFRETILFFQGHFFASSDDNLVIIAATLPWWQLILVPTLGGLVVGLIVHFAIDGARPRGVADVVEACALNNGHLSSLTGIKAAFVNALSIGVGASVGREGPAVHLGAALSSFIARTLQLKPSLSRTLLGCGVAAAVSASFNAPIAGALFAGEVVIGHYALKTFAPVVIASVAGTALSRSYYGDFPAFIVPPHGDLSYIEFPAFMVLALICGLVASILMKGIFKTQDLSQNLPLPPWTHPAVAGLGVGLMALVVPQILGVGYGATDEALGGHMALGLLLAVLAAKIVATILCLGMGFGGGIFSPSLMIGALLGGAFGVVATDLFPMFDVGVYGYALVGMGAVSAAVLGAPISTTLIIFEMTGDYQLTLVVMLCVVISTAVMREMLGKNFFALQLERRGLNVKGGFEMQILRSLSVQNLMETEIETIQLTLGLAAIRARLQDCRVGVLFVVDEKGALLGTITLADLGEAAFDHNLNQVVVAGDIARPYPPQVLASDHLETALKVMTDSAESLVAVVEDFKAHKLVGTIDQKHLMTAYNREILENHHQERDL